MQLPVTLIKGEKVSDLTDYRDSLPVNMYAVKKDILGAQGYMSQYPGLSLFAIGSGVDRGGNYNERLDNHFRVSGDKLISITSGGTAVELGTISGATQARLKDFYSFNTQGIIADGKMFLYDPTNGFQPVTDSDLGNPIDGIWINGYYFLTDGEYIYHTDISDETAIDPLKFATAEFMPDPSLGLSKTQDNKAMVWGRYSLEYFIDAANDNFAFSRVETRAQKIGIVATHAKTECNGVFYITGGRRDESLGVHMITIGGAQKVSTREIDRILEQYSEPELSDVRMETRSEKDTSFVIIHLPGECLCFNESIAKTFGYEVAWTILKTDVQGDQPYRGINGVFDARIGKWIYGDKRNGNIGLLDETITTHYGDKIEWLLYSPFIGIETFSIDELEIETIPGHTSVDDATIAVSASYDGLTYGQESWLEYGPPQNYNQRFIARMLGYVPNWVGFKFRGVSQSKMAFALMKIEYS